MNSICKFDKQKKKDLKKKSTWINSYFKTLIVTWIGLLNAWIKIYATATL